MDKQNHEVPRLIAGNIAVDDRGQVMFVNDFRFQAVKRFYAVSNHKAGMVRAWHAHKKETKYAFATSGAVLIGAVEIDDWAHPAKDMQVHRQVLSAKKPSVFFIPPGYANGFMPLTDDSQLVFFSTSTVEESSHDDVRYDARYWDIWTVVER